MTVPHMNPSPALSFVQTGLLALWLCVAPSSRAADGDMRMDNFIRRYETDARGVSR